MYLYACFDVEDLVHPDSDDIALEIAETLAADGVVASMFVVGEKARLWEQRGRQDVITAVNYHDVGYHTNYHSVHPAVAEFLENKGWLDGVAEAVRQEKSGVLDMARIFGRYPFAWATPGSSWGPQIPAAMREVGVPATVYAQVRAGETGACWFAGEFNFVDFIFFPGAENSYADDAKFEAGLPKLLEELDAAAQTGMDCMGLFVAHPTRLRYHQFWDGLNYNEGKNTPVEKYKFAPRRTDEEYARSLRNLRRLILTLRDHPGIEVIGARDLMQRFGVENHPVSVTTTRALAQKVLDQGYMDYADPVASPAQTLDLIARSLLARAHGTPPTHLPERTVLGPVNDPPALAAPLEVNGEVGLAAAQALVDHIDVKGYLPTALDVAETAVGPGALLRGLAHALVNDAAQPATVTFTPGAEEPPAAQAMAQWGIHDRVPGWMHKPDLNVDKIAQHARLQSWGMKPAVIK